MPLDTLYLCIFQGFETMPATKDTKTKTWAALFYYTDGTGKRRKKHKRGFKTKKEAEQWEREYLTSRHFGRDMTFGAVCDLWFEDNQNKLKISTLRNYESVVDYGLKSWRNLRMEDIDERTIIALQNDLVRRGLAPSTINKYETAAHTLYSYGARLCGVTRDPFKNVKKAGKPSKKRVTFWTLDEYTAFAETLDEEKRTPFDVLFYTGIRIGELMALTVADIDLERKRLHVDKTLAWHERGGETVHEPKTESSARDIALPSFLCDELRAYITRIYGAGKESRVFWLSHQAYIDTLKRYCEERPDVKRITVHDLRHSHVALLINQGVDALTISERLGHAKVSTTLNIYGHLYPDKQAAVADMLDSVNRGSNTVL